LNVKFGLGLEFALSINCQDMPNIAFRLWYDRAVLEATLYCLNVTNILFKPLVIGYGNAKA
jgi:hypothetical protein